MSTDENRSTDLALSTSVTSVLRTSTPWRRSQSHHVSLESFHRSEDRPIRPPTSPFSPGREFEPQDDAQPTTNATDGTSSAWDDENHCKPTHSDETQTALMPITSIRTTAVEIDVLPREGGCGHFVGVEETLASKAINTVNTEGRHQNELNGCSEARGERVANAAPPASSVPAGSTATGKIASPPPPQSLQVHAHIPLPLRPQRYQSQLSIPPFTPIPAYILTEPTRRPAPARIHPITGRPLPDPAPHPPHGMFPYTLPPNHGVVGGPSNLQLLGYAGLEDFPFTGAMISSNMHKAYKEFFRYDDRCCPAGIIYADPRERATSEAWLYVRNAGDVEWKRDYLAERSGMRYWVYLRDAGEGWQWEQIFGDVLDARATLNLWVKRKENLVGTTGPIHVGEDGVPRPGLRLRPMEGNGT